MKTLPFLLLSALAVLVASCEDGGDNPYAAKLSGGKPTQAASTNATDSASSTNVTTTAVSTNATASASAKSGTAPSSSIVGTWTLTGDGSTWYATFHNDKSWVISDDKAGQKVRVYGSYTESNGNFSGGMKNPGVGTGKISGSYSENTMTLYFTEYWHDPAKTVHYKGTR